MSIEWQPLGHVARIRQGAPSTSHTFGTTCRVVGVNQLQTLALATDGLEHAACPANADKHQLRPGDVVVSSRNRPLRATVVPPWIDELLLAATHCLVITPEEHRILPIYLAGLLRSGYGQALAESSYTASTAVSLISATALKNLRLPVPPMAIQAQLAEIFEEQDHLQQLLAAEITARETTMTSLLARFLEGHHGR